MSLYTHQARQAFEENAQIIDQQKDPAIWNINAGLRNLCDAIDEIQRDLTLLKSQLSR